MFRSLLLYRCLDQPADVQANVFTPPRSHDLKFKKQSWKFKTKKEAESGVSKEREDRAEALIFILFLNSFSVFLDFSQSYNLLQSCA